MADIRWSKMAELAGRVGDGMNAPGGPQLPALIRVARDAHERAGRNPDDFIVTASGSASPRERDRLGELEVDRVVVLVHPPYLDAVARVRKALT